MAQEFFSHLAADLYPLSKEKIRRFGDTCHYTLQLLERLEPSDETVLFASYLLAMSSKIDTRPDPSGLFSRVPCGQQRIIPALTVASKVRDEVAWPNGHLARRLKVRANIIVRYEQEFLTELPMILSNYPSEQSPMPRIYIIQRELLTSRTERHLRLARISEESFLMPPKILDPDVSTQPFTRLPDFPISEMFKPTAKQLRPNRQNMNRCAFERLQSGHGNRKRGHDERDKQREQVLKEEEDEKCGVTHAAVQTL